MKLSAFALLPLIAVLAVPTFAAETADPTAASTSAPLGRRMRTDIANAPAAPVSAVARAAAAPLPALPPLPEGVTELRFEDFFQTPVGPRGLELTAKLKALDGKRVRIVGHMVAEQISDDEGNISGLPGDAVRNGITTVAGRFLLAATPQTTNYAHYGLSEDLPPQLVYVTVPERADAPVPFKAGPLLLMGVLSVGPKSERDDRISVVRIKLDPSPAAPATAPLPVQSVQSNNNK